MKRIGFNRLAVLRAERRSVSNARQRRSWSQEAVANRAHIGYFRYMQIENGRIVPTLGEVARLARLFKVTHRDVFPDLPIPEPVSPSTVPDDVVNA